MNSFRGMSRISRKEWSQAPDGSVKTLYIFFNFPKIRKRSRRMRTACLPTVRDSVAMPPDDSTSGGPDMNKFEQVKSDCHQISGGSKGGARDAPKEPKFFQFHAVFWENLVKSYVGAPPPRELVPPPRGKSWIRHCRYH